MLKCFKIMAGILLLLLESCDTNEIYDEIYTFSSESWNQEQIIDFEFAVPDTARAYDLFIQLRNSGIYSYRNLWLFVDTYAPNGSILTDTMEIILADETGRWLGKGIGDVNEIQAIYKQNVFFINRGVFKISIQHAMRDSTLLGVMDIGFRLQYYN